MNEQSKETLRIKNLEASLVYNGVKEKLISDLSLSVMKGEVIGIVGESGCGKTMTALSILGLLPDPPVKVTGGEILYKGEDLLKKSASGMSRIRGKEISMIFQEHMTALNPTQPVGRQVMEVFSHHLGLSTHHARTRTIELFKMVGIPDAAHRIESYPNELSGGMCQRVLIAMAIACRPALIIADEPTTALDVTIQAQVLDLLQQLQEDFDTSMIFISHDLGVLAHIASRIFVMYAGEIVEEGRVEDIYATPVHPYTLALLGCVPRLEDVAIGKHRLSSIRGKPPEPEEGEERKGCGFAPRCEFAFDRCVNNHPPLYTYSENRWTRCFLIAPPEEESLKIR